MKYSDLNYEIIIGKSIGKIKIGMSRQEVNKIYENLIECRETPFGYNYEVISDNNEDFQIFYDEEESVEFILCMNPKQMHINGQYLNKEITYNDLLGIARKSNDVEEDSYGFTCDALGFGVCVIEDDDGNKLIENVQVVIKDYWKNEPK